METPAIREMGMDAAAQYFQHLDRNDKGRQEVSVYDITPVDDSGKKYRLKLSAKLFDIESVQFKLYPRNQMIPITEISIVEYDADRNSLLVKPGDNWQADFARLAPTDIRVISDLKFLVERVRHWYEVHGGELAFPETASALSGSIDEVKYLPGKAPSDEQQKAIRLIFQTPLTYIWGAPGTGKTQYVLAYAVLHYIANRKRVAILAPTNNSIEQVLRGVIKMLDAAGQPRSKVLRLGVPTRIFAAEYPEVCEERGVAKKLAELVRQLAIYRRILAQMRERDQLLVAETQLIRFEHLITAKDEIVRLTPAVENAREAFLQATAAIAKVQKEKETAEAGKAAAERRMQRIGHRISKWFSHGTSRSEVEFQEMENSLVELTVRKEHWQQVGREKDADFMAIKSKLASLERAYQQEVDQVKLVFAGVDTTSSYLPAWNGADPARMRQRLNATVKGAISDIAQKMAADKEYEATTPLAIEQTIRDLEKIRERMATHSTEERLKEVSVIACTLDGYVGRFTEERPKVDHLFLDEAGNANISKALTLFNNRVPITLLGDHLQLPPVCEINDKEIRQSPEYRNVFIWAQSAISIEGVFQKSRDELLMEYLNNEKFSSQRMMQANLTRTFRFGKQLAAVLNAHVYQNGFVSNKEEGETRIYYMHAPKVEVALSRVSAAEVQAIRQLVAAFAEEEDFVILAPYKKQVQALGRALPRQRNDLKILTVHGSQGREWDTVILSVVDTSDMWFVDSRHPLSNGLNLINTAVSRSRQRLIIVCDHLYWRTQHGQLVTDLLAQAELMNG